MGILQARILEWVAMPSSRGSSQPRNRTRVSCIAGRFFNQPSGKPYCWRLFWILNKYAIIVEDVETTTGTKEVILAFQAWSHVPLALYVHLCMKMSSSDRIRSYFIGVFLSSLQHSTFNLTVKCCVSLCH